MIISSTKGATPQTEGMIGMAKIEYNTTSLAAEVGTAPKELRKFLRSDLSGIEKVGKGGRYNIALTATQLAKMKKNFSQWTADAEKKREEAKIAAEAAQAETITAAMVEEALEEIDAEGDAEPTDDDIAEITDDADFDDSDLETIDEA